jgi:hypothetical protein
MPIHYGDVLRHIVRGAASLKDYRGLALVALLLSVIAVPLRLAPSGAFVKGSAVLGIAAILVAMLIMFLGRDIEPIPPVYAAKRFVVITMAALMTLAIVSYIRVFFTNDGYALSLAFGQLVIVGNLLVTIFNQGKLYGPRKRDQSQDAA